MSEEIIEGIRTIEREKGIETGTLVAALEDALLAAYKKTPGAARHAEVILDDDGEFKVFAIQIPVDLETRLLDDYRSRYTIDVSSPGTERPLRKPAHFRAAVGQAVAIRTATEIAGKKRFRGAVVSVDDRALRLAAGDEALDIPYEAIVRGNLIDEGQVQP